MIREWEDNLSITKIYAWTERRKTYRITGQRVDRVTDLDEAVGNDSLSSDVRSIDIGMLKDIPELRDEVCSFCVRDTVSVVVWPGKSGGDEGERSEDGREPHDCETLEARY